MLCNSTHNEEERLIAYCHLLAKILVERLTTLTSIIDNSSNTSNDQQLSETTYDVIEKLSDVLLNSYSDGVECIVNERLSSSNYSHLRNYLTRSVLPCVTSHLHDNVKMEKFVSVSENAQNNKNTNNNNHNKQESIFMAPRYAHSPNATNKRSKVLASSTTHSLQELTDVLKCSPFSFFDCVDHVEFMYICTELDMTRPFVPSCIIAGLNNNSATLSELIASNNAFYNFAVQCILHPTTDAKLSLPHDHITGKSKRGNNTVDKSSSQSTKECNANTKVTQLSSEELETTYREELKCALEVIIDTDARCKAESHFMALPSLPVFSLHEENKMLQRMFNAACTQTSTGVSSSIVDINESSSYLYQKGIQIRNKEEKRKESKERQTNTRLPPKSELFSLSTLEDESVCTVRNTGVFTMQEIVHFFKLQPHQAHKHLYECPRCHLSFLRRTDTTTLECLRCRYNAEFELLHHPLRSQHAQLYQWSYIVHLIDHFDIVQSVECIATLMNNPDESITISEHGKRAKLYSIMHILVQCANSKASKHCNTKVNYNGLSKTTNNITTEGTIDVIRECLEVGVRVFVEHLPEHVISLIQLQSGAARRISTIPRIVNLNGKKQIQMSDTKLYETLCKLLCVNAYVVWVSRLRRHVKDNIAVCYKKYVHTDALTEYNTVPLMFIIYALINAIEVSGNEHARQLLSHNTINNNNNNNTNNNKNLLFKVSTCLVKLIFIEKLIEESTRNRQVLKKEEQQQQQRSKSNTNDFSSFSVSSQNSFASSALESLELNNDAECLKEKEIIAITNSGNIQSSNNNNHDHIYYINDEKGTSNNVIDVGSTNINNSEYKWHSYLHESQLVGNFDDKNDVPVGDAANCIELQQVTTPMQIPLTLDNLHTMQRQQRRQEKKPLSSHKRMRDDLCDANYNQNFKHENQEGKHVQENVHCRPHTEESKHMEISSHSRSRSCRSSSSSSSSLASMSSSYSSSYSYDVSASSSYSHVSSKSNAHSRASSFSLRSYYANSNNSKNARTKPESKKYKTKRNKLRKYGLQEEKHNVQENFCERVAHHAEFQRSAYASANRHLLNSGNWKEYEHEEDQNSEEHSIVTDSSGNDKSVEKMMALYYIAFCEVFGTVSVAHARHYLAQVSSSQLENDRPHSSSSSSSSTTAALTSHLPTPASHLWMPHLQRCTQGGMTCVELITEFVRRVKELTQCVRLIQD